VEILYCQEFGILPFFLEQWRLTLKDFEVINEYMLVMMQPVSSFSHFWNSNAERKFED